MALPWAVISWPFRPKQHYRYPSSSCIEDSKPFGPLKKLLALVNLRRTIVTENDLVKICGSMKFLKTCIQILFDSFIINLSKIHIILIYNIINSYFTIFIDIMTENEQIYSINTLYIIYIILNINLFNK